MKEKIRAILTANCDYDIKIDLLDALIRVTAQEFKTWAVERDDLIMSIGVEAFADDCSLLPTEIWERFVLDTQSKFKKS